MREQELLAEQFERNRARLRAVAYRLLGTPEEADDAVQEAWLRLSRAGAEDVENLAAWLTTVVSRICLDALRSRKTRREVPLEERLREPASSALDPESEAVLADSVGLALLVVLETLSPAERVAFVLHDMFDVPYAAIAAILGRSASATRKLASRARRRVRGAPMATDASHREEVVAAFMAATHRGDFQALLALLDPDAVLHFDAAAVQGGAPAEVRGASAIAGALSSERAGAARAAQRALLDGEPGLAWAPGSRPRVVFAFRFEREALVAIDVISDPDRVGGMRVELLGG